MILKNFSSFFDQFFARFNKLGIDISSYELDHVGYQSSSVDDYDKLKTSFSKFGELFDENIVGGRRVGLFRLHKPLVYKNYALSAIELIEPKEGQQCPSAFEHAEFVINEKFNTLVKKYPSVDWDVSAVDQPMFPMVKIRLGKHMQVKFHYESVLDISKHKKKK